jgi:hypothetical protein
VPGVVVATAAGVLFSGIGSQPERDWSFRAREAERTA